MDPPQKTWIETLFTGPSVVAILVALIGNAVFSVIFQIRNNDQQEAAIRANALAMSTFQSNVSNLQTPLGQLVTRMDGRLSGLETRVAASDAAITTRVDTIDRGGTRSMESVVATQQRLSQTLDRIAERMILVDQRITELQSRSVVLNEQFNRTDRLVDQIFTYLRQHSTFGEGALNEKDRK